MIRMLGHLTLSQGCLRLSSFLLIRFSFYLSDSFISTILSSISLILSSASVILLLVPFSVFDIIYCIIHYILTLFSSSRSLLNHSCIFSILISRLFICDSILISRFWIISLSLFGILYQVDSLFLPLLFGLMGIYPVPLPSGYFSASSSCLYCCVWGGLSVFWKFVVPLYCGGISSLWLVLDGWLVKVSWLGKLGSVFWWVELDFFSLECNEVSSNEL